MLFFKIYLNNLKYNLKLCQSCKGLGIIYNCLTVSNVNDYKICKKCNGLGHNYI